MARRCVIGFAETSQHSTVAKFPDVAAKKRRVQKSKDSPRSLEPLPRRSHRPTIFDVLVLSKNVDAMGNFSHLPTKSAALVTIHLIFSTNY